MGEVKMLVPYQILLIFVLTSPIQSPLSYLFHQADQ